MENRTPPRKVLVAVRPKDRRIVEEALGSEFDLVICHTLEDAEAHLDDGIGLIACGVRFDNGRMFDLLRAAKANLRTAPVPFYLLLGKGKGYSPAILDGIRSAAMVLGAAGFTDLSRLENELGRDLAYQRLREVIRQSLQS